MGVKSLILFENTCYVLTQISFYNKIVRSSEQPAWSELRG